jgi:transposase
VSEVIIIGLDIPSMFFTLTERIERYSAKGKLLDFFAAQLSCTVAQEACGGAHHWAVSSPSMATKFG